MDPTERLFLERHDDRPRRHPVTIEEAEDQRASLPTVVLASFVPPVMRVIVVPGSPLPLTRRAAGSIVRAGAVARSIRGAVVTLAPLASV